jgi:hypothetical protein
MKVEHGHGHGHGHGLWLVDLFPGQVSLERGPGGTTVTITFAVSAPG